MKGGTIMNSDIISTYKVIHTNGTDEFFANQLTTSGDWYVFYIGDEVAFMIPVPYVQSIKRMDNPVPQ